MNNGNNNRNIPRGNRPPQGQPRPQGDPRRMGQNPGQRPAGQKMPPQGRPARPAQGQPRPQNDPRRGQMPPRGQQTYGRPPRNDGAAQNKRKATREQMKAERSRIRKEKLEGFLHGLAVYGVILVLLAGIIAGVFFGFFYSTPDDNATTVTYFEKFDGKHTDKNKFSEDVAYPGGVLYVNFTNIAKACDMTVIADSKTAKFVFYDETAPDSDGTGHEEYAVFGKKSTECTVCGQDARLSAPAVFDDGDVWIPADFVEKYVDGITVEEQKSKGRVYVTRNFTGSGDDLKLDEVSFKLKAITAPEPAVPDEDTPVNGGMPEVTFATDLSKYEDYMNPADATEYLVLVNKTSSVDATFVPGTLTSVVDTRDDGRATQKMQKPAAKALEAMFIEMRAAGYTDVSVTSAYRSYEYQEELYNGYVKKEMGAGLSKEEAQAIVDTYSARPGTSEHQTGLCCDLHNLPGADKAFANEEAYEWLCENAWKFGFILRFPEDKTDVTGYDFEPWHYRYVGRNAAWIIHNQGMCLEEYVATVK